MQSSHQSNLRIRVRCIILTIISIILLSPRPAPAQTDSRAYLTALLEHKDYFRLRKELKQRTSSLSDQDRLYFRAHIENAFNDCQSSIKTTGELLKSRPDIPDSVKARLLQLQEDNYVKTYQYGKAADVNKLLLSAHQAQLDSATQAEAKNSGAIWRALSGTPAQKTEHEGESLIKWKRDKAGLMRAPVTIGNETIDFVFDTGANLSTITRSMAEKMGLRILDAEFDLGSITALRSKSAVAVAQKVKIGKAEIENVVFLVLPDDKLAFPSISYKIEGIIGFPVFNQLGEIRIAQNGSLTIPQTRKETGSQNLALDGLTPVISLVADNDTLTFTFDTGAKKTELYKSYLDKHAREVKELGQLRTVNRGGAGGVVSSAVYTMPEIRLSTGTSSALLKQVNILTTSNKRHDFFYGNLGQDFIQNFAEMTINFKEMYISFSNP